MHNPIRIEGQRNMRSELKKVAIWSAMVFLLGMPLGVYLMSRKAEAAPGAAQQAGE